MRMNDNRAGTKSTPLKLEVDTVVPVLELVQKAARVDRVVIRVDSFADGRLFSQVRGLAESAGFAGAITVRGDLLPEQAELLYRYGVEEVVLENGLDIGDAPGFLATGGRIERGSTGLPTRASR